MPFVMSSLAGCAHEEGAMARHNNPQRQRWTDFEPDVSDEVDSATAHRWEMPHMSIGIDCQGLNQSIDNL